MQIYLKSNAFLSHALLSTSQNQHMNSLRQTQWRELMLSITTVTLMEAMWRKLISFNRLHSDTKKVSKVICSKSTRQTLKWTKDQSHHTIEGRALVSPCLWTLEVKRRVIETRRCLNGLALSKWNLTTTEVNKKQVDNSGQRCKTKDESYDVSQTNQTHQV